MMFINHHNHSIHRKRNKALGVPELIAIALGGMVGGGIFTILGISVSMIGAMTPVAIIMGGLGLNRDENSSMAIIGLVLGVIDFACFFIAWFWIFSWFAWPFPY